jgi:hypothetical protein
MWAPLSGSPGGGGGTCYDWRAGGKGAARHSRNSQWQKEQHQGSGRPHQPGAHDGMSV